MPEIPHIEADIRRAATLPGTFYRSPEMFQLVVERVFRRTWHYAMDSAAITAPRSFAPVTLLPAVLDEPIVLTNDGTKCRSLSNVCTHRGAIIAGHADSGKTLRCPYHGRCFELDGSFKSMPAFEDALDFPSEKDHLPEFQLAQAFGMFFVGLNPIAAFEAFVSPITERLDWLPFETLEFDQSTSKDYLVPANWALYCDNYLEGLHIPYVHPSLNQALEFKNYSYELFEYGNLQLGIAKDDETIFDIPHGARDHGQKIFAYYFWIFPNLMLNIYPWGISVNIVEPMAHDATRVRFRTYRFAGSEIQPSQYAIEATELEDEEVVNNVQIGVGSRFYDRGRYSPSHEQAVHHFHRLLVQHLNQH